MKMKKIIAISAAILTIPCMSANIYADTDAEGCPSEPEDSLVIEETYHPDGKEGYLIVDEEWFKAYSAKNDEEKAAADKVCFRLSDGSIATGLVSIDGIRYRFDEKGLFIGEYTGWTKKGEDRYYYKDGVMKKNCWITSNGKRKYFLGSDGKRAVGIVTVQGVEYEFDENGVIVPDKWGLTLTAKDVTPTGLTVVFTQEGGKPSGELNSGSYYQIQRYTNGKWTDADWLLQEYDVGWTAEAWIIGNNDSVEFSHSWEWLYGELPAGKYRIGKEIMDFRKPGDYDTEMYWAYFEIR